MMRRLFEPVMRAVANGFYMSHIRLARKAVKEAKEAQAPLKIQPGTRTPVGFRYSQKELAPQDIWAPGALIAITSTYAQQARLNWDAWKSLDRETTEEGPSENAQLRQAARHEYNIKHSRLEWNAMVDELEAKGKLDQDTQWRLPMSDESDEWINKVQEDERMHCEYAAAQVRLGILPRSAYLQTDHDRLARNIQVVQNKLAALEMKLMALQKKLAKSTGDEK